MSKDKCLEILRNGIDTYLVYHDRQDDHADNGLHLIIGKIAMAVELGFIGFDEMDRFLDDLFEKYALLQKD